MALISVSLVVILVVFQIWIILSYLRIDTLSACPTEDFVFSRKGQISLYECVKECNQRNVCTGLGYRRRFLLCELYFGNESQVESFSPDNPCIFILKEQTDQCGLASSEQCTVKECTPFSVRYGVVKGNMNHIGARKVVECNEGYLEQTGKTSAVCQVNGTWDHKPVCIPDAYDTCSVIGSYDECQDPNAHCQQNPVQDYVCTCYDGYYLDTNGICSFADCAQGQNFKIQTALQYPITLHYSANVSRDVARNNCKNDQGELVRIDSVEKLEIIRSVIQACPKYNASDYWIDGSRLEFEREWFFEDGSPMTIWSGVWMATYSLNEHCVRLRKYNAHLLNDRQCDATLGYICEYHTHKQMYL